MRTLRNFRRHRQGSQMVEFALVAPVLLFLVLSIPVFALVARSWLVISAAARDGAREASLFDPSMGDRAAKARQVAAGSVYLERQSGSDTLFYGEQDVIVGTEGNLIVVTVIYRQPSYVPFLSTLLNPSAEKMNHLIRLEATARFRMEGS